MKILFVTHNFPRHAADVPGAFLLSLANGLKLRGHQILVVAPHDAGIAESDDVDGISVRRFRYASESRETLAYRGTMADQALRSWRARFTLFRFLGAFRSLARRTIREWRPDVIHAHWWFPAGVALGASLLRRNPSVLTSHGTDLFLLDRNTLARRMASRLFRAATRATVISNPLVERVTALGVPRETISVIPMPVDRSLVDDGEGRGAATGAAARLLFAGRLTERKGAEYAIRALSHLLQRGRDMNLTIVGDGPLRVDLDNLCDELGLGTRVHFTGVVSPPEVQRHMRAADILLMPAVTDWKGEQEGFGMVIVEAMLNGLPVVASASGGIADVVRDGVNGILVPERDSVSIADAVERIAGDEALRRRLSQQARASALEQFHPDVIAQRFEAVYQEACSP